MQKNEKNYFIYKKLEKTINEFSPTIFLPNSVLQIIFGLIYNININYERQIFVCKDGGEFAIDMYPNNFLEMKENTPIIFFICGASGDSSDNYAKYLSKEIEKIGWRIVIINKRGFAEMNIKSDTFFNFHDVSDLEASIDKFNEIYPKANKYLLGVSMGGNYVTKYLGTKGKKCGVKAGVAISNPWSLYKVTNFLSTSLIGKIISKVLVLEFKKRLILHKDNKIIKDIIENKKIKIKKLHKIDETINFDKNFTSKFAGFENIYEYYYNISSENFIDNISIPFLTLTSKEDPICRFEFLPIEKLFSNPNIISLIAERGGHIEYFSGIKPKWWGLHLALTYFQELNKKDVIKKIKIN